MAVYFPREQRTLTQIQDKPESDYRGVAANDAHGLAFVCNQELTVAERASLQNSVSGPLEL